LSSVFFLDAKTGWAAGGSTQPYAHCTLGVVVRTQDGGQTWTPEKKLLLPAVERIGFFDKQRGWAVGAPSAVFPSGVYSSEDGGRSWSTLPSSEGHTWLAGEFIDSANGALAGATGAAGIVRRRSVEVHSTDAGLAALARIRLVPPRAGWLVGDGGLVRQTVDLGNAWQPPPGALPPEVSQQFDFAAVAVRGPNCWIAGDPGTRVLHTGDAGQTWNVYETKQPLPINALAFADAKRGWAVGALGTILATEDSGRTWHTQRAGGTRAAALAFCGRANDVPLELIARLAADEGYLTAVEILGREDIGPATVL
jgi:photosystem II stability/assembly factor-like uncharacterized protein